MSEESPRARLAVVASAALFLLGVVIALLAFAPWVSASSVGDGGENVAGVALSSFGWSVFGAGALLAIGGVVMFVTRRLIAGVVAMPLGALVLLVLSSVRADLHEVRGYLEVEGSAAGISSPVTRAFHHHPLAAIHQSWAMGALAVAAVLAVGIGVVVTAMCLLHLRRRDTPRDSLTLQYP